MRALAALMVMLAIGSGAARADDADEQARRSAREHFAAGTSYFDLGRYEEAVAEYEAAYRAKNEPALLYNIAQAHRLAGHAAVALRFYKRYLTKLPKAPNREEVLTKIETLEKLVEQQQQSQSLPPDQPLPPSSKPEPVPVAPPPAPTVEPAPPAAPAPSPLGRPAAGHKAQRIAGAVLAGAGLALVGGGIACGVLANNAADAISRANQTHAPYDDAKYNEGKTDQILEGVLLGIGAAAVAGGAILVGLSYRAPRRANAARLSPQVSSRSAGLSVSFDY